MSEDRSESDRPSDFASEEDRRFVRATAARTLRDADLADDAAQDAWLAALRREPRLAPTRAWLAVAVRSRAADIVRERLRRERREQTAARAAHAPDERDGGNDDARRAVVEAALGLEEPYRSAVLLRYFLGEPPRSIARRLGVPVSTVRTRLARGLRRLRADFGAPPPERRRFAALNIDRASAFSAWTERLLIFALGAGFMLLAEALPYVFDRADAIGRLALR
jgi:RNA polymerase sigma factor (sigma-70 family)